MKFVKSLVFASLAVGTMLLASGCATSKSSSISRSDEVVTDVQEFTVDGIPVIMRQSVSSPVVSAVLFIKGGSSALDTNQLISTEYFAMALAPASGTQRIGKSYFRRRQISMGTQFGGDDGRDYSALSMRCLRETFDTSWSYLTDMITAPAFDPVEFDNFRRSVLLGLNSRKNDPDTYSNVIADSIYFQGHPYGRMINTEDVKAQTLQNVAQHYKSIMVKSRLLLSVVGNISRKELTEKIHQTLSTLPEGSYVDRKIDPPAKAFTPGAYFPSYERKLPTDYVLAYYLIPSKGDPDYYPYLRLRNFFGGFVFNHIRVQNNLAYAPNVDDREGKTSIGVISVQTPYVDSAVGIIYNDVDFFQTNRIRESVIKDGVAGWATRNFMKTETTQSQAVELGRAKLTTGDWRNAFFSFDKLARVTPDQIVQAARKYLRNFNWVIVGDTSTIQNKQVLTTR